jgi:hypothetical protein
LPAGHEKGMLEQPEDLVARWFHVFLFAKAVGDRLSGFVSGLQL